MPGPGIAKPPTAEARRLWTILRELGLADGDYAPVRTIARVVTARIKPDHLSRRTVENVLYGGHQMTIPTLMRLCNGLQIDPLRLLYDTPPRRGGRPPKRQAGRNPLDRLNADDRPTYLRGPDSDD
jgi:hypothetical protein